MSKETAETYVASIADKVPYSATFIPQSQSRNAGKKELTLNWRVTVGPVTADYQQGIGLMPGYDLRNTKDQNARRELAAEKGKMPKYENRYFDYHPTVPIPPPPLIDVLYALVSDADVLEHGSFESWAESYGLDTDSRKAEAMYMECLRTSLALRQVIDIDAAREAFQDY